ncbi:unnamed protein product [Linum tenue]|uniref:Uncharacterized protein n=1 Tax=Linum tenue TaxID=586396 RepID=A0AAV0NGP1_9ROSI|nr:unnamed protein product [Linum tenue]
MEIYRHWRNQTCNSPFGGCQGRDPLIGKLQLRIELNENDSKLIHGKIVQPFIPTREFQLINLLPHLRQLDIHPFLLLCEVIGDGEALAGLVGASVLLDQLLHGTGLRSPCFELLPAFGTVVAGEDDKASLDVAEYAELVDLLQQTRLPFLVSQQPAPLVLYQLNLHPFGPHYGLILLRQKQELFSKLGKKRIRQREGLKLLPFGAVNRALQRWKFLQVLVVRTNLNGK